VLRLFDWKDPFLYISLVYGTQFCNVQAFDVENRLARVSGFLHDAIADSKGLHEMTVCEAYATTAGEALCNKDIDAKATTCWYSRAKLDV